MSILENAQEGVRWSNLHVNIFDGDKYTGEKNGVFSAGGEAGLLWLVGWLVGLAGMYHSFDHLVIITLIIITLTLKP